MPNRKVQVTMANKIFFSFSISRTSSVTELQLEEDAQRELIVFA
jgi:hypothetical protein